MTVFICCRVVSRRNESNEETTATETIRELRQCRRVVWSSWFWSQRQGQNHRYVHLPFQCIGPRILLLWDHGQFIDLLQAESSVGGPMLKLPIVGHCGCWRLTLYIKWSSTVEMTVWVVVVTDVAACELMRCHRKVPGHALRLSILRIGHFRWNAISFVARDDLSTRRLLHLVDVHLCCNESLARHSL